MSVQSIEDSILNADPATTKHLIKALIEQTQCPICREHMFVPFMTKCGHNFCYGCIIQWFRANTTCPVCRGKVDGPPYLNLELQNTVMSLLDLVKSLNNGTLPVDINRELQLKLEAFKRDLQRNDMFKRIFRSTTNATLDYTDGIRRCGNCFWEVEGATCENCHANLRESDSDLDGFSSANTSDLEELYEHGEDLLDSDLDSDLLGNADEDDSFIDDRDLDHGNLHQLDPQDSSDDDASRDSSPVRRPYFSTVLNNDAWEDDLDDDLDLDDYEDWHGFHNEANRVLSSPVRSPSRRLRSNGPEAESSSSNFHSLQDENTSNGDSSSFNAARSLLPRAREEVREEMRNRDSRRRPTRTIGPRHRYFHRSPNQGNRS